jgi:hypothetical protein
MYARATWFRLEIAARDREGGDHVISPTSLARRVTGSAAPFLAGSDHLRRTYDVGILRARLVDVARLACGEVPGATSVTITLVERASLRDLPEERRVETVVCTP